MIKIPACDLPMVPLVPMVPLAAKNVQGFLVTIGKNGTNSIIGRFADFTIGRTPNVANFYFIHGHDSHVNSNQDGCAHGTHFFGQITLKSTSFT